MNLEEIKEYMDIRREWDEPMTYQHRAIDWLIAEVEQLKAQVAKLVGFQDNLEWAAFKLVAFRQRFGNAGFSTDDLDRLMDILGHEKFMSASEPVVARSGVWGD